jgi:hypothetical protein
MYDDVATAPDKQHHDIWQRFIIFIMISCDDLESIDFSYCVNTELQARLLCDGIVEGLIKRMTRITKVKPLKTIKIRGLDRLSSAISKSFRDNLKYLSKDSDTLHKVHGSTGSNTSNNNNNNNNNSSSNCDNNDESSSSSAAHHNLYYGVESICTSGSNLYI